MGITVRNLQKRFGDFVALDNVSLDFPPGELVALLGPSGCGKTTLLRVIAGLEYADAGQVVLQGQDVATVGAREREVGFVFQHYALFRHMTVFENVAFGLRVKPRKERPSEAVIREKVHELLKLVQLDWLAQRYPSELSGGQRQRIALARALAVEPKVLLLDEPFGALDAKVRKELRSWLRRLHDDLHISTIFVTHDQEEALEVADRVVVMDRGHIRQAGTPQQIYDHPISSGVHEFIGESIIVPVTIEAGEVRFAGQSLGLDPQGVSGAALLFARPHDVTIVPFSGENLLHGVIKRIHGIGPARRIEIALNSQQGETLVEVDALRSQQLHVGQSVGLRAEQYRLFPNE
jgi:sulfate/thiosulfate transport system ATP-binding protein